MCGKTYKSTYIKLTKQTLVFYQAYQSCVDIEVWHYHFINEISTSYIYNLCKRLPTGNDPCNINNSVHPLKDKTGLHCLQGEYMCEGDRERASSSEILGNLVGIHMLSFAMHIAMFCCLFFPIQQPPHPQRWAPT